MCLQQITGNTLKPPSLIDRGPDIETLPPPGDF